MTAVRAFKAETRSERLAREQKAWILDAVTHLIALGVYAPDELEGANDLAESIWENSDNATAINPDQILSAKDAVDEELTYWGD